MNNIYIYILPDLFTALNRSETDTLHFVFVCKATQA